MSLPPPLGQPDLHVEPDEIEKLYQVSREINSVLGMDELLNRVLDLAIAHAQAERGILFFVDPRTGESFPWAVRGLGPQAVVHAERFSRTVLDHARREAVHSDCALDDPRFKDADSVRLHEIRAVICVPIAAGGRLLAAIYLDNLDTGRPLCSRAVRFIGILAGLAAVAIQNSERYTELLRDNNRLLEQVASSFDCIVGRSRPMRDLLDSVERVAGTDFPVLLVGESGTGKELVARAIHQASRRASGPFIAQNCAAIPAELLESEFFGHARGAFTGAVRPRDGLFRLADGGTLFLDEIADLDLRLQAKLLRVLEDGAIRPLGSTEERKVDLRVLSATSANIRQAVRDGRFRQDLLYRLNVVTVEVPPLRERRADIPHLLRHFMEKHGPDAGGRMTWFTDAALSALEQRSWKGNVRELEHFAKRALVLADGTLIDVGDLPRLLDSEESNGSELGLPLGDLTLAEIEGMAIREALKRTGGNRARAAELLGLHRNALLRRLRKLGERHS